MAAKKKAEDRPGYVGPYVNEDRTKNNDETNSAAFSADTYQGGMPERVYDAASGGYIYKTDGDGTEPSTDDSDK